MSTLPSLNALHAFDHAGRFLNFRAAADAMGVTQGAVAQHIRQLESDLGVQLFRRQPKGLLFTAEGRSYHARISAAFAELKSATDMLKPEPGKVLVSVTPTFAAKWLIPNLPSFSAQHPKIDLRILATEALSSFHRDGIDLAIRQGTPPFGAALTADQLFRQEVIAVASPALLQRHTLGEQKPDLTALPRIFDAHDLWPEFLRQIGMPNTDGHGLRLSQTALAVDAALAGQGVALVSRFLVERDLQRGDLVQVTDHTLTGTQDFYLLSERRSRSDPAIQAVRGWLLSKAEL